ncbi:DUF2474 domain-containing protein [Photobacterium sp. CCB-ST2H9]|nr:DUF2474 domain-containing protein [Photobacterium sp. CCB-ST2H9]UTM58391.1 DUF2474 domain-containing protein [Photobacterium sp. CCB-ST2H9]
MFRESFRQWLWLAGIWGASVAGLACISWLFRLLMSSAGLTT